MKIRAPYISKSITNAITDPDPSATSCLCIPGFDSKTFRIFDIPLSLHRQDVFSTLRSQVWGVDEEAYLSSFSPSRSISSPTASDPISRPASSTAGYTAVSSARSSERTRSTTAELIPIGDLGYSGSTFFTTPDGGRYLIKSLPRRFEHAFFTEELLDPYWSYMTSHSQSLLVRIVDVPYAQRISLGGVLGTAPMCHIVMENLLYDEDDSDWETFDLKPADYFFPERDVADGMLATDDLIESLVDHVPHKIIVSEIARKLLLDVLREDTELLAGHAAVDYSLFLARRAANPNDITDSSGKDKTDWREGVPDTNGEWVYRAVVLDFFWAKSRLAAKAMTGLVDAYNVVADQGPMSITAEPGEYRDRFMRMVGKIIVGPEET